jgi:hypothetical protein
MTVTARRHGTQSRYCHGPDENDQPGGCRCAPCREATRAARKDLFRRHAYGRAPMVPTEHARAHLLRLCRAGLTVADVARAAGLPYDAVARLRRGQHQRANAKTVEAVLALSAAQAETATFTSTLGAQRRVRALARLGWTLRAQAALCGMSYTTLKGAAARRFQRWTTEHDRAVRAMYERLAFAPLSQCPTGVYADICRRRAVARGWASPAQWWDGEDDWIDDPGRGPSGQRALPVRLAERRWRGVTGRGGKAG